MVINPDSSREEKKEYCNGFVVYTDAIEDLENPNFSPNTLDQLLLSNGFLIKEEITRLNMVYMFNSSNPKKVIRYHPTCDFDKHFIDTSVFKTRIDFFGDTSSVEEVVKILKSREYKVVDASGKDFEL